MPLPGWAVFWAAWFSSYLLRRGNSLNFSRKLALGLSAALMPAVILVPHVPVSLALALFSVAFFGQQSWSGLIMTLPTDIFPLSFGRLRRRTDRLRRRHRWSNLQLDRRPAPHSRSRLRHCFCHRGQSSRGCLCHSSSYFRRASSAWFQHPSRTGKAGLNMKITRSPHTSRTMVRRDNAIAAALLHQPHGPAHASAIFDEDLHLP